MSTNANILNKILANWIPQYIKRIIHNYRLGLIYQDHKEDSVSTNQCDPPH